MNHAQLTELCAYAKDFSQLSNEKIAFLHEIQPDINASLTEVTHDFYRQLDKIPKTAPLLEGRIEYLQKAHQHWLEELFSSPFDEAYTEKLYMVGDIHVKVKLPVEFMVGGMTLIQNGLISLVHRIYAQQTDKAHQANMAINAAIGFSLLIMQESYQSSSLSQELEKFLGITGISRTLFDNLAKAYDA